MRKTQFYLLFQSYEFLFKNFDPFTESLETSTQIGTVAIFTKSFVHLMNTKMDYKILNINGQIAGSVNIELSRCDENGNILEIRSGLVTGNKSFNYFFLLIFN